MKSDRVLPLLCATAYLCFKLNNWDLRPFILCLGNFLVLATSHDVSEFLTLLAFPLRLSSMDFLIYRACSRTFICCWWDYLMGVFSAGPLFVSVFLVKFLVSFMWVYWYCCN